MMRESINICWGTACPLVTHCARSDFNKPAELDGRWTRHHYPMVVGDHCAEFLPLEKFAPESRR